MGKFTINGPFSMAMLNNQRVHLAGICLEVRIHWMTTTISVRRFVFSLQHESHQDWLEISVESLLIPRSWNQTPQVQSQKSMPFRLRAFAAALDFALALGLACQEKGSGWWLEFEHMSQFRSSSQIWLKNVENKNAWTHQSGLTVCLAMEIKSRFGNFQHNKLKYSHALAASDFLIAKQCARHKAWDLHLSLSP